ncbi:ras-related protein Rab-31 isoform X2 [Chelonia mydas]|uniref:ras-related protein Rab-31 isoform X2 n=1 Tax=Chelonia mydas TaxID=8469 RepID=UPI000FFCC305|nr:ras-related protein Rab-31 isoform X2 [Chelonia mydas]
MYTHPTPCKRMFTRISNNNKKNLKCQLPNGQACAREERSASFMTKTVPCGNELHKFLIWDTAGQERFHSLAPMYYRGSAAAVIVYDITKQDSFHTLKKWVKELKEHGPENIVMAIAGNKCDLSDLREVPMKDAKEYAESIGAIVVETSAKNAINIEELFQGISRQIPPLDSHENGNNGAIKLGKQTTQTTRRCC